MQPKPASFIKPRPRRYIIYLVLVMGIVAIMDQYLSMVPITYMNSILDEYGVTASQFEWWEALYLIPTFFIFALNGLVDIIGRKFSILVLILIMGFSSLGIVLFTPTFHFFMIFYSIVTFTTVSNMWAIPISEESPATKRAKLSSLVYVIGLFPLSAIIPLYVIPSLGWKWMYGIMFFFMIPVLVLWVFMKETGRYEEIKEERKSGKLKKHIFGLGSINRSDIKYIIFSAFIWMCWLINSLLIIRWMGYYFMEIHGYARSEWLMVFLASGVMMIIGGISSGVVMDRIGRKIGFIIGATGFSLSLFLMAFGPVAFLPISGALTGFFIAFSYAWVIVYIPEIFPTERRGACLGWTTTVARISYIVGPVIAAVMLETNPTMEWFWVVGALLMILAIIIVLLFHPFETKVKELEEIEVSR
ncbi:MAG: General substrate transporter [Thermoplasmatales archaeon]|jgi:MFS family permease|nr:General substrate transporter [Thermoplasmatales archaeon]